MPSPRHRDTLQVLIDGEEVLVYNWVNLARKFVVRPITQEEFEPEIGAGDSLEPPDYVTDWLAELLWHEYNIDVEEHGIEVVDVTDDGVEVL